MNIIEYLCREARRITKNSLSELRDKDYWIRSKERRREMLAYMLGLSEYLNKERHRPEYKVTGVLEREGYRIEKVYFESLQGLYVTGNLYVPEERGPKPIVLYLCGHSFDQKFHYQFHGHKFARLGFVTFIMETIQKGEIRGHHHGTYHYGWFNWYSLGYTPAGVEVWNAIRALDFLQELPYVDKEKIGVTGISGGGAMSWFTAAIDERIKVVAPVCSTGTIESHICKRTL
ncbi:MAG: acetylxylan esterase, partial [Thermoprotei archaeon]